MIEASLVPKVSCKPYTYCLWLLPVDMMQCFHPEERKDHFTLFVNHAQSAHHQREEGQQVVGATTALLEANLKNLEF